MNIVSRFLHTFDDAARRQFPLKVMLKINNNNRKGKQPKPQWEHLTAFLQVPELFVSSVSSTGIYILAWNMVMVWNYYYLSQGDSWRLSVSWSQLEQLWTAFPAFLFSGNVVYGTWYFDDSWDYGGTLTFGLSKIIGQHQKASGFCVAHIHTTLLYRC